MRLFLASGRTFLRYKEGRKLYEIILGGRDISELESCMAGHDKKKDFSDQSFIQSLRDQNFIGDDDMKLYLSANGIWTYVKDEFISRPYILESFYYAMTENFEQFIPMFGDFLLDSGAFTFMQNSKTHVDWNDYIKQYADFINRNKVEKFFELDIDSVVGYDEVLKLRSRLEDLTGRQSIPVWHVNRGKNEFIRMCKEYDYVAIGGLVNGAKKGEYARKLWPVFPWFINTAHENGAKIHALGFTSLEGIQKYHFDSVDSTAWTTGNRYGFVYKFNGTTMTKVDCPKGKRLADSRQVALINYIEWIKFQKYAETHL